ncbi:MAG: MoxR family ATPase [Clostridia bacterium]|nr:MoxR family ATPase [Clostridia bacterium]
MNEKAKKITDTVNRIVLGKEREVTEVFLAILANGHILIEDIPGVGKTTLALAFAGAMSLDFKRIQFTPDVMPSDLTGFSVYRQKTGDFEFREGAVFCNLCLADEINRTSPKTQSAMLEVMEERRVTVEGVTRDVPRPFIVIATENETGSAGTLPLPESQTDRFIISLSLGYPDFKSELQLASEVGETSRTENIRPVISRDELLSMQSEIHSVYIKDTVYEYILNLVRETRENPLIVRGASPRATIALVRMSKAAAWYRGRDFVTPADVAEQFPYVVSHRITSGTLSKADGMSRADIIGKILSSVKSPPAESREKTK